MSTSATPHANVTGDVVAVPAGPTRTAGISLLSAGPACVVCGIPFLWPALAAMGLGAAPVVAHAVSWVMVPLVVILLARNTRRHRDRRPLLLAAAGAVVYGLHVVVHAVPAIGELAFFATDYLAVALLGAAALWDLAITRRVRRAMSTVRQDDLTAAAGAL